MKTGLGITFVILGYYSVFAQENGAQDVKMKKPSVVKSSSAPVTHAEAKMVLDKAWNALAKGLKVKGANPVKIVNDQNPMTKNEVLSAYKLIVAQVQPMFKRSASPATIYPSKLRKDFDQRSYLKLLKDGFVMPVGPLVVGKDGPLQTSEFGDSVGVLLVRISDLIHMPTRKFSPSLMDGKG